MMLKVICGKNESKILISTVQCVIFCTCVTYMSEIYLIYVYIFNFMADLLKITFLPLVTNAS